MTIPREIPLTPSHWPAVLGRWPADCRPTAVLSLGSAGGFSGGAIWQVVAPRGTLCLRRWPAGGPTPDRLASIHAVLRHTFQAGFSRLPLPVPAADGATFQPAEGTLWELTPWLAGDPERTLPPSPDRLAAAMTALAQWHLAAATFPEPGPRFGPAPAVVERLAAIERLIAGGFDELAAAVDPQILPELSQRAPRWFDAARTAAPDLRRRLAAVAQVAVPWQPCLRDIHSDHVLFVGDEVTGLLDFGALRTDHVTVDLARLLESYAGRDQNLWNAGLATYKKTRPLSTPEQALAPPLAAAATLLAGANWLRWTYRDHRHFPNRPALLKRFDQSLARLTASP